MQLVSSLSNNSYKTKSSVGHMNTIYIILNHGMLNAGLNASCIGFRRYGNNNTKISIAINYMAK